MQYSVSLERWHLRQNPNYWDLAQVGEEGEPFKCCWSPGHTR